ncbi:2-amino-4-hydroxy-6-hydroxymethyldihydropteridine diphosphokinase [Pseudomaricurvus sp.]|uniref:2-amino-4-hydroxy-6- hydroxymethyldihydropteridine diphosphokinase n=1 Tax=Pseudomaricurvus sp. TaxID=2004510 RepID=UPI003F6C16B4
MSTTAYIGLGSNLENPYQQVKRALQELGQIPQTCVVAASPWYQSLAVGPGEQPDFVNGVAQLTTELDAHALLDQLQAIENAHERVREVRWGPRTLDLDLLLFGAEIIDTERLQVPHPYLTQRNFVLYPLADIAPQLTLPGGDTLESLVANCPSDGLHQIQD